MISQERKYKCDIHSSSLLGEENKPDERSWISEKLLFSLLIYSDENDIVALVGVDTWSNNAWFMHKLYLSLHAVKRLVGEIQPTLHWKVKRNEKNKTKTWNF